MIAGSSRLARSSSRMLVGNHPRGGRPAGKQDVGRDRRAGQVGGHHPGQGLDSGAGGSVGDEAAAGHRLVAHRDRDHPSAARAQHARDHLPGDQERPGRLGLQHVAKGGGRHLPEWLRLRHEPRVDGPHPDPGVVDQEVQAAEQLVGAVDRRRHRAGVADVELEPQRSAAQLRRRGLRSFPIAAGHRDPGARLHERVRHRPPQAAGPTGHQHAGAAQPRHRHVGTTPPSRAIVLFVR